MSYIFAHNSKLVIACTMNKSHLSYILDLSWLFRIIIAMIHNINSFIFKLIFIVQVGKLLSTPVLWYKDWL